jgi:hypothetical protein
LVSAAWRVSAWSKPYENAALMTTTSKTANTRSQKRSDWRLRRRRGAQKPL